MICNLLNALRVGGTQRFTTMRDALKGLWLNVVGEKAVKRVMLYTVDGLVQFIPVISAEIAHEKATTRRIISQFNIEAGVKANKAADCSFQESLRVAKLLRVDQEEESALQCKLRKRPRNLSFRKTCFWPG